MTILKSVLSHILQTAKQTKMVDFFTLNSLYNGINLLLYINFPGDEVVKKGPVNAGDARDKGSLPGLGRS